LAVDETAYSGHSNEALCGALFIMLYKVVRTLEFLDKILRCDHDIKMKAQY